jgi:transcriptional regulator with XRE-family HTH domain
MPRPNHYFKEYRKAAGLKQDEAAERIGIDRTALSKVENGKRISLAPKGTPAKTYGMKTKVPGNTWNKLGVRVIGNLFTVLFNDQKLYEVEDNTFTQAGKVGLWTKADSVIHFDDFTLDGK